MPTHQCGQFGHAHAEHNFHSFRTVRGLPALLYRPLIGGAQVLPAALLQATSLPFIVASTAIGLELDVIDPAGAASLVAAGLLSVVLFPALAVGRLRGETAVTPAAP